MSQLSRRRSGNLTTPFSVFVGTVLLRLWSGLYGCSRKPFPDLDKLISFDDVDEIRDEGNGANSESESDYLSRHCRISNESNVFHSLEVARSL